MSMKNNLSGSKEKPAKKPKNITYGYVYDILSKIDTTGKTELKNGFTYLKWSYATALMNAHFPQHHIYFVDEKHKFLEDGSQEIYCRCDIPTNSDGTGEVLYKEVWYPVTDYKNSPIIKPNCFDLNTARMRAMVKCYAMFGLGIQIFHDGTTMPEGLPPVVNVTNKTLLKIKKLSKSQEKQAKALDVAFDEGLIKHGLTNAQELGTALQPNVEIQDKPFEKYNMRASNFIRYAFGSRQNKEKKYVFSYADRKAKLQEDIDCKNKEIDERGKPFIEYGVFNERCGIAEWCLINQTSCANYGDFQESFKIPIDDTWSYSATPDGIMHDKKGIVEVKCSKMGKACYDDFPKQYIPQIEGQLWILNTHFKTNTFKYVDLVNWTPDRTKIWRYTHNPTYLDMLKKNLEQYRILLDKIYKGEDNIDSLPKKPYVPDILISRKDEIKHNIQLLFDTKKGEENE